MATKPTQTGWVGWIYFAGLMMVLAGAFQVVSGLAALFKEEFFVVGEKALLISNYTAWGWGHLIMGVILLTAGVSVMAGGTWGRFVGVVFATLGVLANLAFLSAYPLWSLVAIVVNILVIYAITIHGTEAKS